MAVDGLQKPSSLLSMLGRSFVFSSRGLSILEALITLMISVTIVMAALPVVIRRMGWSKQIENKEIMKIDRPDSTLAPIPSLTPIKPELPAEIRGLIEEKKAAPQPSENRPAR